MDSRTLKSSIAAGIAATALLGGLAPAGIETVHASMSTGGAMVVSQATADAGADPLQLRVEVSYRGWNGSRDFTIDAQEGQQVEITFVWADTAVPDNAHRIRIKGYDLVTPILDIDNREYTLKFIADKTGTFELMCEWRCEGHKEALDKGALVVNGRADTGGESDPGAGVGPQPANLTFDPGATSIETGPIVLTAALVDENQQPIVGAPVRFFLSKSFAGTKGEMELGIVETDASGVASLEYAPTLSGDYVFSARFPGQGLYGEAEQVQQVTVTGMAPAYFVADKGLDAIRDWAPAALFGLLAAVWSTFGYVLYQVVRIRNDGEPM